MKTCEKCGKPSENSLCPQCLSDAISHGMEDEEKCFNCLNPCKPCETDNDETKVYNDLNEKE